MKKYLKVVLLLDVLPENWLAFGDAIAGIKSAKDAGMKIIAIASIQPKISYSKPTNMSNSHFSFIVDNIQYPA